MQQRLDLHRACELGVPQPVPVTFQHQEVREAGEPAVEHRGLVDDGRAALDRTHGLVERGAQSGVGVGRPADDRDVAAELLAQVVELTTFMLVTECRSAGEQFVFHRDRGAAPEFRVERPQQRVLAPRRGSEIGGAVDDVGAGSL